MPALAQSLDEDLQSRAANDDDINGGPGTRTKYSYDIAGRLEQQTIALPNYGSFTYNLQYNTGGQVSTLTYPATVGSSALALQYSYNNGILQSILDVNDATTVWTANTTNAAGETTEETLGNGVQINRTFDPTALSLLKVTAGPGGGTTLQNQSFLYDPLGNVIERADGNLTTTENFYYDQLNRLNYSQLTGPGFPTATNLQMCYDNSGGTCTANLSGPGNVTSKTQDAQLPVSYNATWSSYNYPLSIGNGTESVSFSYGPSRMRWQQNYNNGAEVTNYIGGLLEQVVTSSGTSYRHYVFAGAEHVAVVNRTSSGDTVTYMLSDEQGSLTALLNSVGGTDVSESFTAYGARRNPASWNGAPLNSDLTTIAGLTRQGYTFQSALGQYMGLNHMNGRVEDAITGRFMSPDPYITDPTNTQDYDRYSYVYNSPLTLIDPSGFSVPCVWVTDPVTGNLLGGGCLGPSFNMGGGQTNNIISSITPLTAADLQQIFAPQLKLALDELANYKPQTTPTTKPTTPAPTPCPNGGAPSRANNSNYVSNVGLGALGAFAGTALVVANIIGFPEVEVGEAGGGAIVGAFELAHPIHAGIYAGAYALIPGGAAGALVTAPKCLNSSSPSGASSGTSN